MVWQKQALVALREAMIWLETSEDAAPILQQAYHQNRWFEEFQVKKALQQWTLSL